MPHPRAAAPRRHFSPNTHPSSQPARTGRRISADQLPTRPAPHVVEQRLVAVFGGSVRTPPNCARITSGSGSLTQAEAARSTRRLRNLSSCRVVSRCGAQPACSRSRGCAGRSCRVSKRMAARSNANRCVLHPGRLRRRRLRGDRSHGRSSGSRERVVMRRILCIGAGKRRVGECACGADAPTQPSFGRGPSARAPAEERRGDGVRGVTGRCASALR